MSIHHASVPILFSVLCLLHVHAEIMYYLCDNKICLNQTKQSLSYRQDIVLIKMIMQQEFTELDRLHSFVSLV